MASDSAKAEKREKGVRIGYRLVFLLEYLGPIIIFAVLATRPALIYGAGAAEQPYHDMFKLSWAAWIVHFAKREYETLFVHKFSRATLPLSSLFINCGYYYGFAAGIGYFLCHPHYQPVQSQEVFMLGMCIFVFSEICNFRCHCLLRDLRADEGSKERPIPRGFAFTWVSCPNYFFESLAWVGYSIMSSVLLSWVFTAVGFFQMLDWARGKHRRYLREHPEEYKKLGRKAMVPFLI